MDGNSSKSQRVAIGIKNLSFQKYSQSGGGVIPSISSSSTVTNPAAFNFAADSVRNTRFTASHDSTTE